MVVLRDHEDHAIRLTDERWRHIVAHPEMSEMRSAIEETLCKPQVVVQSMSDPEARLYYRFCTRTMVSGKYLCTVVKILRDDAFVVTAYLTNQVKRGEILWQEKL